MPQVRIADKRLWVDDQARALLSGEVHYWRLDPARWRDILGRVREMGLQIISTYVPWHYHELRAGEFDFAGTTDPRRGLAQFLDLAAEAGFWVLLRPGPYIYAEWRNMGVPDRVVPYHRLHPEFLRAAGLYLDAALAVARPYLATQGGPVVMLQADNEPEPWVRFYAAQLGLAGEPGPFQEFLRARYRDIAALNENWGTALDDFAQARAVTSPAIRQPGYLNRYLDFRRFLYAYSAEIARWSAGRCRQAGVDVPVYTNAYPSLGLQNWRELEAVSDLCGVDLYPSHEFRQAEHEHRELTYLVRHTRTYSALPCITEFEAGTWHGLHYSSGSLTPHHYRLACLSALLAGVAGWNWYMLVNRDNWYMSPINEQGYTRPELFETFAGLVALFRELDPPSLHKLTETGLAWDVLSRNAVIDGFHDPVLDALYQAGLDYECCDLDTGQIARPLMFYGGENWQGRPGQDLLRQYVETGGHLVLFQNLPVQDDSFRPLNRLDLRLPDGVLTGTIRLELGDQAVNIESGAFFVYDTVPGTPLTAERVLEPDYTAEEGGLHWHLSPGERVIAGYRQPLGQGSVICLGVPPSPAVVLAVHRWLGVPVYSRARLPGISTALFRRGATFFLIAVNNGQEDRDARVDLYPHAFEDRLYTARDLLTGESQRVNVRQAGSVTLYLPAKDGTVLRIEPGGG